MTLGRLGWCRQSCEWDSPFVLSNATTMGAVHWFLFLPLCLGLKLAVGPSVRESERTNQGI